MISFPLESARRSHPARPGLFQWYVSWALQDWRGEGLYWLMDTARVPAILCTEFSSIRGYAPPICVSIVSHPIEAVLDPIEGFSLFECIAALERWALDFNEVER